MRVSMPLQRARTSSPSASSPWRKRNSSSGGRRRSHEDFEDGPLHGLSAFLLKGSRAWSEPPPSLPDFVGPVLVRRTLDRRGCGLFATEYLDAGRLLVFCNPATDIKAGEEITITYVDALVPLQQRREASQAMKFGFVCNCRRCAVEQSVEPLLRDASCRFCVLHKKAAFEVTNAITSRGSLPLDSAFPACTELSALFSSVHTSVASHDGLSDVERQWILSGYASAFLGMWLVSGYSTGFADSQRFVNRATLDVVHSIKTTMPGLLQTLSLIAHLIGIAQKMDGNEQLARELFDLGIEESLRVYGKRNLDVLTELIGKSLEVIPFF